MIRSFKKVYYHIAKFKIYFMKKLIVAAIVLCTVSAFGQQQTNPNALDSLRNEKDTVVLQQKLKRLGGGTERNMLTVMNYYTKKKTKRIR